MGPTRTKPRTLSRKYAYHASSVKVDLHIIFPRLNRNRFVQLMKNEKKISRV